jgi:hypothetical protein
VSQPTSEYPPVAFRLTEKPPVPLRHWVEWMAALAVALVVFYVILTPVWMGIRLISWLAEGKRFRLPTHGGR